MSSKLRETTPRRRRVLAAPFVLTAALSGGCYVQQEPQPQPQPGYGQQPPPAQPEPAPTDPAQQPPPVVTNPPPPGVSEKPQPPTSGGKVVTNPDGTCWWQPDMPDCPPGVACNPPRPHEVACPTK